MKIRLGVIGDEACINIVEEISNEYPEFSIRYFTFNTMEDTVSIIQAYEDETDMWLLLEPYAYLYAKEWGGSRKQLFHIPYRGASLFKTLCEIFYNANLAIQDISFDTVPYSDIKRGLAEMNIQYGDTIFVNDFFVQTPVNEIFQYHYDLWKNGKIKAAVTCIGKVKDMLMGAGVPVYRVLPVRLSIRSMFYNMFREFNLQIVQDAQIAVQVFEFCILNDDEKVYSTDEIYNEEIKLTQKLIAYARKVRGSLKAVGQGKFFVFTTRGSLKSITDDFRTIPSIEEFEASEHKLIACGIGIGLSAYEAEFNATTALRDAKRYGKGAWMIVFDDKTVTGPLGKKEQLTYSHFSDALQNISCQTSISVATLSKIIGIMEQKKTDRLSAQDLAQYMHILPRSARRIIARLENCGIAIEVGEENPNPRGRPRKLYCMKLGQA
ncbi:hypothetical protein [Sporomusa aerivorans]|uniref:hypothetical protein n=1 Tax=Sporomusa aerivorans TaxID=204936 RepID=UPI00352AF61D